MLFISISNRVWASFRELIGANTKYCSFYFKIPIISLKAYSAFAVSKTTCLKGLFENTKYQLPFTSFLKCDMKIQTSTFSLSRCLIHNGPEMLGFIVSITGKKEVENATKKV